MWKTIGLYIIIIIKIRGTCVVRKKPIWAGFCQYIWKLPFLGCLREQHGHTVVKLAFEIYLYNYIQHQHAWKSNKLTNMSLFVRFICAHLQGCHIWVGPKFPDISLTIPWHITIFPWQFTLFFQVKNKDDLQKQWKILVSTSAVSAINQLM